ncbi:Oidioi.mRNA.OKI2018_I69.XSR.g13413.t1.cds [Oikopleura dioica]|uniref:Oidioi.mRNA.OKI2018_I69.XSR.g13413.t1.cds n=1 Tax=Oikopleura dioica TaxID=34765 RepID=A0ABN7S6S9_OIKDI|nr:Oidioi.mRNA.OKI2018_I69.XSR.g13413.t1.cds [Oikopleura dioica]
MDSSSNGSEFSGEETESYSGPSIIEVFSIKGYTMETLVEAVIDGPLGEGWGEDDFLLLADIITDEKVFYAEDYGPDVVIDIIKRFLRERPDETEFEAVWLSRFIKQLICGIEKYAESQSDDEYVKTQHLLARVFDLWYFDRSAEIRRGLFRAMWALFDDFFIKKELKLPSKHLEFIKLTMLIKLTWGYPIRYSDEYSPEKSMAKKIVDLILGQEQPAPVQVAGFELFQILYDGAKNREEIFENFEEFAKLLEKESSLVELCRRFQTISAFDQVEKVMYGKTEYQKAYLSFQRKFALMMVMVEDFEAQFFPIFKHQTESATIKISEKYVVVHLEMEYDEHVTIFFNRNSSFHGKNIEDEGESSSFEATAASPAPASAKKELKFSDLERRDSELAPLSRGLEDCQLKLKRTRATEENSSSKVSGEMRGSRGSTPDLPVESSSSPADLNLAPPPKMSKPAKTRPSSNLLPDVMAKLREKFASISQLMPRVEESIEEIQAVKKQFDEHLEAREDLRRNVEKVMKDSEELAEEGERMNALAVMLKEYAEKLIADMNRK